MFTREKTDLMKLGFSSEGKVMDLATELSGVMDRLDGTSFARAEAVGYEYGLNIDPDDTFFVGGAASKTYLLGLFGERPSDSDATGDSNDAIIKSSYNNYASNDANFIIRGLNMTVTNRSGGDAGRIEHFLGTQIKSGGAVDALMALTLVAENYGSIDDSVFGLDVVVRNEGTTPSDSGIIKTRNDDRSGMAALGSALEIASHASSGGLEMAIDASGATLEATSNKVILMKFKDSDGDTRWLTVNNSGTVAASDSHS